MKKVLIGLLIIITAAIAVIICFFYRFSPVVRISYPGKYALVSADVPVSALFHLPADSRYSLFYGEGTSPDKWFAVTANTTTASLFEVRQQQLGVWHTGLTNYRHGKDYQKLSGFYTLRLSVTCRNKVYEDKIVVQVGDEVPNITGGFIRSRDSRCELYIPSHAQASSNLLGGITLYNPFGLVIPVPYQKVTDLYELKPVGIAFLQPVQLWFKAEKIKWVKNPVIGCYNTSTRQWQLINCKREYPGAVSAELPDIPSGNFVLYGLLDSDLSRAQKPVLPDIFNRDITSTSNYRVISSREVDLRSNNYLFFKYKLLPEHQLRMSFSIDKRWYSLDLGDATWFSWQLNAKIPGFVWPLNCPAVVKDGQWHEYGVDMRRAVSAFTNETVIDQIELANWDSNSYMDWSLGRGFTQNYQLKDIRFSNKPAKVAEKPILSIGFMDESNEEFGLEDTVPARYIAGTPFDLFPRALSLARPITHIDFPLSGSQLKEAAQSYLYMDVEYSERETSANVVFIVSLNGKDCGIFVTPRDGTRFWVSLKGLLRKGANRIELSRVSGGKWITWDCLAIKDFSVPEPVPGYIWFLGRQDNASLEFTHELNVGVDYYVGHPLQMMKKGVSKDSPSSVIHFIVDEANVNKKAVVTIAKAYVSQEKMAAGCHALVEVFYNGQSIGLWEYAAYDKQKSFDIPELAPGDNVISIIWRDGSNGGEYFDLDYLSLK